MTNTKRAHITIEESYWDLIEELVDVYGATIPQVISNIVTYFFNNPGNDALLMKLRARKRKLKPPEEAEIEARIKKYLKRANNIPLKVFIDHMKLDKDFVISHLDEWGEKFSFIYSDDKIVKE